MRYITALDEASDNSKHLQSLRGLIESMEQGSIADMQPYITAFMRVVELIWQHSRHYCSAPRIIILLQEVNNMLIDHVRLLFDINYTLDTMNHGLTSEDKDRWFLWRFITAKIL